MAAFRETPAVPFSCAGSKSGRSRNRAEARGRHAHRHGVYRPPVESVFTLRMSERLPLGFRCGLSLTGLSRLCRDALHSRCIVDAQFFTGVNLATGTNEDFLSFQLRYAIGIARMVNSSCAVAIDGTVDEVTISDIEKEGVVRLRRIPGRAAHRGFPWDPFSLVFADQFLAQDRHGREHAFAVNG